MIFLLKIIQFKLWLLFFLPAKAAVFCMRLGGEIVFQIAHLTQIRKITAKNLAAFFPNEDCDLLAEKLLKNISRSIFEILSVPFFNSEHIKLVTQINGKENLDAGINKGKGVLLLTMHTGNYELTPMVVRSCGYPISSILKADDNPVFEVINRTRSYKGAKLINVLEDDMFKESFKALKENAVVLLLIDTGAAESRHETIEFLGKRVPVASGWITLAKRAECEVVPVISLREGDKVVFNFGKPLSIDKNSQEENMLAIRDYFEGFIKNHPDQWAMFVNEQETKRMINYNE